MAGAFNLDAQGFARLRELLDIALALDPGDRAAWLDALPEYESHLRARISALLALHDSGDGDALMESLPRIDTLDFAGSPEQPPLGAGATVGPYELTRQLGVGGMGTVWLAQRADGLIERPVALKLPRVFTERAALAARMARERKILASLNHENIARLYDAGISADGQPYLALEYVEGTAIDVFCQVHELSIRERLALFREVVVAVAYAHAKLVVHRDLKPANVLVTADSRVKLLDFGIGKLLAQEDEAGAELTRFTGRPLTLEYASPEQVRGDPIGTASDVYSLGVLLYRLLTGVSPYGGRHRSRVDIEQAILSAEPQRPSTQVEDQAVRRALRGDVDTVVLKALRKNPDDRYSTANALADDIDRHLTERPVSARPDSFRYRVRKFVSRNRLVVSASAAVAVLAIAGLSAVLWQARVAIEERRKAQDIAHFIESIFNEADPYERSGAPVSVVTLLERAQARADRELAARPDMRVHILIQIGGSLLNLHANDSALRALDDAVEVATGSLGSSAAMTLQARTARLGVYRLNGDAARLRAELADLWPALRASTNQDLLRIALQEQAHAQIDAGEYSLAVNSASEAYALARQIHGDVHSETTRAAVLRALSLEYARDFTQAERAARESVALALASNHGDPQAADVIEAQVMLARVLGATSRLKEASAEMDKVIAAAKLHFGRDAIEIGFYENAQAKYLLAAGALARAEAVQTDVVRIMSAQPAEGGINLAVARVGLAAIMLARREETRALEVTAEPAAQLAAALPAEHPFVVRAHLVLALGHARLGHPDQAALELSAIPARIEDSSLASRVSVARSTLAALRGDRAGAEKWARAAVSAASGASAAADRLQALPALALALVGTRKPDEASAAASEALALSSELQMEDSPERAEAWQALGGIAAARGDCREARQNFAKAAAYWKGKYSPSQLCKAKAPS